MSSINQPAMGTMEYYIDMAEALTRLEQNADFQKVILKGYLVDRAVMGVSLLADESTKRAGKRPEVFESLVAISSLEDHFNTVRNLGASAAQDLQELEAAERTSVPLVGIDG